MALSIKRWKTVSFMGPGYFPNVAGILSGREKPSRAWDRDTVES